MNSILIPTDFSHASYNTISYGIALAKAIQAEGLVIYNAYQPFVSEDPVFDTMLINDISTYKSISEEGLEKIKKTFEAQIPPSLNVIYESDYNTIEEGIKDACEKHKTELILMNITGSPGGLEEILIGSTAVSLSRHSKIPVLIIPQDTQYSPFKKILLALDFKKLEQTTPVNEINKILDATGATLNIVHVEPNKVDANKSFTEEKNILNALFVNHMPEYHFIQGEAVTTTINNFADEIHADLMIVIPKKHGFLENIFKGSSTKKLAFHSHIPVLSIHE